MTDRIEQILERVEKPVRYIGGELNAEVRYRLPRQRFPLRFASRIPTK